MHVDRNKYALAGGETFCVLGDRVLIRMDPDSKVTASGNVHIPQTAHETILGTGTILAYGKKLAKKASAPVPIPGLSVGVKCCFIKFLKEQGVNQQFRRMHESDVVLLQSKDILFLWDKSDSIRVS